MTGNTTFIGSVPEGYHLEFDTEIDQHILVENTAEYVELQRRGMAEIGRPHTNGTAKRPTLNELDQMMFSRHQQAKREPYTESLNARFTPVPFSTLVGENYTLSYLIDGILVEGQPCVLGGPKKTLKTTIGEDLAISLATGTDFLSKFPVIGKKRVLYCSGESGRATLRETAVRIAGSKNLGLETIDNLFHCFSVPKVKDDYETFGRTIKECKPQVVIFDCLYLMLSGDDAGNVFKMGQQLAKVCELCLCFDATPIVVHHAKATRKDSYVPLELDDLAWAGCAEFFRQWLLLNRQEAYEPSSGLHKLWLTAGGSAGHSSQWGLTIDERRTVDDRRNYSVTIASASNARKFVKDSKLRDFERSVLKVLAEHTDGLTKNRICELADIHARDIGKVLSSLAEGGEIATTDVLVSNQKTPKEGYKLVTN